MDLGDYTPRDLAHAATLPARWYVDPAMLALERAKVFQSTWQMIGRTASVAKPGDYFAADIAGEPVVVSRGEDGVLRAFSNVCRHRASLVAEGAGNTRVLRCPYHGWTYALDGRGIGQPEFEGVEDWDRAAVCLPSFDVATWGPFVFVRVRRGGPSLEETLGAIPPETRRAGCDVEALAFHSRRDYVVNCNWKVYVDNYLEGYHVPAAHPGLFRELDYKQYRVDTFRYYSSHFAPIRMDGNKDRRYAPRENSSALYYWIFPNFMLNIYPDNMSSNVILPLGHDRTLAIFEWYFPPERLADDSEVVRRTLAFSDEIQVEDTRLCENVQRGLQSSTYDCGRLSVQRENGVHHFHLLMHEFLAARS